MSMRDAISIASSACSAYPSVRSHTSGKQLKGQCLPAQQRRNSARFCHVGKLKRDHSRFLHHGDGWNYCRCTRLTRCGHTAAHIRGCTDYVCALSHSGPKSITSASRRRDRRLVFVSVHDIAKELELNYNGPRAQRRRSLQAQAFRSCAQRDGGRDAIIPRR